MSHHDTGADHIADLVKDYSKHTPDEQQHIMAALFEKGASTILKGAATITGDPTMDAAARMLDSQANTDIAQGHLNFKDYSDIFKTIDHYT